MSKQSFQSKLEKLRGQFGSYQQLASADPERARASLPSFLSGLRDSLDELQHGLEQIPENGRSFEADGTSQERSADRKLALQADAEARLELGYAATRLLAEATTFDDVAPKLLELVARGLDWDIGEFWSLDGEEHAARRSAVWARPDVDAGAWSASAPPTEFPARNGSPAREVHALWIADSAADAGSSGASRAATERFRSRLQLSISAHDAPRVLLRLLGRAVRPREVEVAELLSAIGAQVGRFLEREQLLARLRDAESRNVALLEASLDAVVTVDAHGRVLELNGCAERLLGLRRGAVVDREVLQRIVPPRLLRQALDGFERFRSVGARALPGRRFEASVRASDGVELPVEVALASSDGTPALLTLYVRDTTERKVGEKRVGRYQERLRSLTAELLLAEEQERRRLAVDLHDGLSQTIALAQIKLSTLRHTMGGKYAHPLDEIEGLIEQANRAARSISFELSPPVLHDFGLEPAVQWLVENIQSRYGTEIRFEDDGAPKPTDERTRVILFRSIRELLINAAKHARAHRVLVSLKRDADRLSVSVDDDGVGMEPSIIGERGSGLFSIHERMNHVGGSMRIESILGKGTRIHLCAPIARIETAKVSLQT